MQKLKNLVLSSIIVCTVGCSSLLPTKTVTTQSTWNTYTEAESVIKHIRAGDTLDHLRAHGLDVNSTPNMRSLTYLDIAKRFGLIGLRDESVEVPDGVKKLMAAAEKGKGYELKVEMTNHERFGSFWADFFQFRKKTRITGWELDVLLIVVDNKVQYVLYKGNPNVDRVEIEKNPLGPFQKINGYVLIDLATDLAD